MGRKANDGRGRLGGRAAGTRNKPKPQHLNGWLRETLNAHRATIEQVLNDTNPADRYARAGLLSTLALADALNRATDALDARTLPPSTPVTGTNAPAL